MKIVKHICLFVVVCCLFSCHTPIKSSEQPVSQDFLNQYQDQKGPLVVDYFSPEGPITVNQNKIVIHFTQPMVPLEALGPQPSTPFVTLSPRPEGYFKWVNSRTLIYQVKGSWEFATTYHVTVHAGKESLLGFALLKDHEFEFQTPAPAVTQVTPVSGSTGISRQPKIKFELNQPVQALSVRERLLLQYEKTQQQIPFKLQCYAQNMWQDVVQGMIATSFVLIPDVMLEKQAVVQLTLETGVQAAQGTNISKEKFAATFETHGDFSVSSLHCMDKCLPHAQLAFKSATPFDEKDLENNIVFDPPVEGLGRSYKYWSQTEQQFVWYLDLKPFTTYTVTLSEALKDTFGQTLGVSKQFQFTTAHYTPEIHVPYSTEQVLTCHPEINLGMVATNVTNAIARYKIFQKPEDVVRFLAEPREQLETFLQQAAFWDLEKNLTGTVSDQKKLYSVPGKDILKNKTSGIVLSDFTSPDVLQYNYATKTNDQGHYWLLRQITDLALDVKLSKQDGLVWITSLSLADNVSKAAVTVYDRAGVLLFRTITDAKGFAKIPGYETLYATSKKLNQEAEIRFPFIVFASTGSDQAFVSTSWSDDLGYGYYFDDYEFTSREKSEEAKSAVVSKKSLARAHLLTDRGLYKPEEKAEIKGYVRTITDQGLQPYVGALNLEIRIPQQDVPVKIPVTTNQRGNFIAAYQIDKAAALGDYYIYLKAADESLELNSYGSFQVQQFRKPEFKVSLTPQQKDYVNGENVSVTVKAEYLFGAPMKAAPFTAYLRSQFYNYMPETEADYQFGRLSEHQYENEELLYSLGGNREGLLSDEGSYIINEETQSRYDELKDPVRLYLDAEVSDLSQQKQAAGASVVLHPASFYIGATAEGLFYQENETLKVSYDAFDLKGSLLAQKPVKVDVMRVKWVSVQRETLQGQYESETKRQEDRVAGCDEKNTEIKNNFCEFSVKESGYYFARLHSQDEKKREVITEIPFYVTGSDYAFWPTGEDYFLDVVADKSEYEPGDIAKILVKSPYQNAQALISIERDGVLSYFVKPLVGSAPMIDIPIEAGYAPNVFAKIVMIKGEDDIDPSFGPEGKTSELKAQPLVKTGMVELVVHPPDKNLVFEVKSDKALYEPREDVQLDFTVKNLKQGQTAELTVMVVDEGVLLAGGYQLKNPLTTLYEKYYHEVSQIDSRSRFIRGRGLDEKLAEPASGGGRLSEYRKDFIPLAYYNGAVETNDKGEATIVFRLPDQLTTFKVMAIANAGVDHFGLATTLFKTQKQLMVRPALPRFLRVGDSVLSQLVLHNNTAQDMSVEITAEAEGLRLTQGASEKKTIPAHASITHTVGMQVDKKDFYAQLSKEELQQEKLIEKQARISFQAKAQNAEDLVQITLPVYAERSVETVAFSGASADVVTEFFQKGQSISDNFGGLRVKLQAHMMSRLQDKVKTLKDYPYDCLEQRLSKIYPFVLFPEMDQLFIGPEKNRQVRDDRVNNFLKKLRAEQNYYGGFAFWPHQAENPALTLMVAEFLVAARQSGFVVDDLLDKILQRILNTYLNDNHYEMKWYAETYRKKLKIQALVVLALAGKEQPSYYGLLREDFEKQDLATQLRIIHLIGSQDPEDPLLKQWFSELNNKIRVKGQEAVVEWSAAVAPYYFGYSDRIVTAQVLRTLLRFDSSHVMLYPLLFGMLHEQQAGSYVPSLETLEILKTLKVFYDRVRPQADAVYTRLLMNGKELLLSRLDPREAEDQLYLPIDKLPENMKLELIKDSGDVFFYELRYDYALEKYRPYGLEEGISLQREYYDLSDNKVLASDLKHGQTYKVVLNFYFADKIDYLVVEEPVAAGLEPLNFALKTTNQRLKFQDSLSAQNNFGWFLDHKEFRDKNILLYASSVPRGFYEFVYYVNVTNAGQYITPSAMAREMYHPEIFGTTSAETVGIQ